MAYFEGLKLVEIWSKSKVNPFTFWSNFSTSNILLVFVSKCLKFVLKDIIWPEHSYLWYISKVQNWSKSAQKRKINPFTFWSNFSISNILLLFVLKCLKFVLKDIIWPEHSYIWLIPKVQNLSKSAEKPKERPLLFC